MCVGLGLGLGDRNANTLMNSGSSPRQDAFKSSSRSPACRECRQLCCLHVTLPASFPHRACMLYETDSVQTTTAALLLCAVLSILKTIKQVSLHELRPRFSISSVQIRSGPNTAKRTRSIPPHKLVRVEYKIVRHGHSVQYMCFLVHPAATMCQNPNYPGRQRRAPPEVGVTLRVGYVL